uniref:Radical SAM protein n=1 Tax=candidate division WOR-3 bacterium TaxID=2052148 RepID=A0A7C3YZ89_UNCW3
MKIERRELKGNCLHDFPYPRGRRKCPHSILISATESGGCLFRCPICYARAYPWSKDAEIIIYNNLIEKLRREIGKAYRLFPIYLSQVTDPLQPLKEIRELTRAVVSLLMEYNLSFGIVTKSADGPLALLRDLPKLKEYPYWFLTITIEATPEKQVVTSPFASPIPKRFRTISYFNHRLKIPAIVRIDPTILGIMDKEDLTYLLDKAWESGSPHIIGSTGYFNKTSILRVAKAIKNSPFASRLKSFFRYYRFNPERISTYSERKRFTVSLPMRIRFHTWLRKEVEKRNMTYAVCQELPKEYDSQGIPSCEGAKNIFVSIRNSSGKFQPIPCHGDCLRFCPEPKNPPCGYQNFLTEYPFKYQSLFLPPSLPLFSLNS